MYEAYGKFDGRGIAERCFLHPVMQFLYALMMNELKTAKTKKEPDPHYLLDYGF